MTQSSWHKYRTILLKLCSLSILLTLFYLVLNPDRDRFARIAILNQWESINTDKIKLENKPVSGKKYQETNNHNLAIEVFLLPTFRGDSFELIQSYFELEKKPDNLKIVKAQNLGAYGLFTQDKSAYLATCIHPGGQTAFTATQFTKLVNHNLRDRLFPWILGLSDLRDWRCFWVSMSVELENLSQQEANQLLQTKLFSLISQIKFE